MSSIARGDQYRRPRQNSLLHSDGPRLIISGYSSYHAGNCCIFFQIALYGGRFLYGHCRPKPGMKLSLRISSLFEQEISR